jgi:hypothetical protein
VVPVQPRQPLPDDEPQPQKQRELRIAQVLLQALGHLDVGLLDHVRGVQARLEAGIEAYLHHAAQPVAVPGEQRVQGLAVSCPGTLDQVHGLGRVVVHQAPHTLILQRNVGFSTSQRVSMMPP